MRLFVSVDLPDRLAAAIGDLQAEFDAADGLRFTDPTQAHITLKFFGTVSETEYDEIVALTQAAVEAADTEPFRVTLGGLGVFPSREYIRVLWLGVEAGGAKLSRLHDQLEQRAVDAGFDPAQHSFTPHVTLARMEHAGGKDLVQAKLDALEPTVGSFEVTALRVTESELTDDGPVYHTRERIPLSEPT